MCSTISTTWSRVPTRSPATTSTRCGSGASSRGGEDHDVRVAESDVPAEHVHLRIAGVVEHANEVLLAEPCRRRLHAAVRVAGTELAELHRGFAVVHRRSEGGRLEHALRARFVVVRA